MDPTLIPPPIPQTPSPGWWARNWKWVVPSGVFLLVTMAAGFVFAILSLITGVMKSNDAYKGAVARAVANPQVRDALGTPIREGFMPFGNVNTAGPSGHASLEIRLSGPKNKASLYVEATRSAGTWTYTTLEVAVPGLPERIDLRR